uniref:Uncharacterized protein n=1 Tax=Ciona intestinalis TaxID=7719 RepID=H2XKX4_CIOIN
QQSELSYQWQLCWKSNLFLSDEIVGNLWQIYWSVLCPSYLSYFNFISKYTDKLKNWQPIQ